MTIRIYTYIRIYYIYIPLCVCVYICICIPLHIYNIHTYVCLRKCLAIIFSVEKITYSKFSVKTMIDICIT